MRPVLVIDNYDSFSHNLYQAIAARGYPTLVHRNDAVSLADIQDMNPSHIVISPGPCTPKESGISPDVVREFGKDIPILGVCLGHQAIASALGGRIIRAETVVHGKPWTIRHDGDSIYRDLPNPIQAARYHSLIVDPKTLPDALVATAWTEEGTIMGLRHREWPVEGVQFHPESFMTPMGNRLIENFLEGRVAA